MPQKDERADSGFWAFWSSLPGILTGVAAVLAAGGTLAALFVGSDPSESPKPGAAVATEQVAAKDPGGEGCFSGYFEGIPRDRIGSVEAGATHYDVISESQPKAGTIGMTFTNNARPIGAIRFAFFPKNGTFKIESIVDAHCSAIEDYGNLAGGDKHVLQDSGTVRVGLAGGFWDLTTIAWGSAIRVRFVSVVP
jgi:hypothetical protein